MSPISRSETSQKPDKSEVSHRKSGEGSADPLLARMRMRERMRERMRDREREREWERRRKGRGSR